MSKRIDDYKIIIGASLLDLEKNVKKFFDNNEGYELVGGVSVNNNPQAPGIVNYYQAVVKYKD